MLRDVVGGKEPSAEVFLREVAPAVVGAMDEATQARVTEALRVRLDGSPGTLELSITIRLRVLQRKQEKTSSITLEN